MKFFAIQEHIIIYQYARCWVNETTAFFRKDMRYILLHKPLQWASRIFCVANA